MDIVSKVKATYDLIALDFSKSSQNPWAPVNKILNSLPHGAKILDLGCGNGRLLNHPRKDLHYLGLDFSTKLLAEARRLHPGHQFEFAELTDPKALDNLGIFNAIFSIGLIHHLPNTSDQLKHLQSINDHLKPGGLAVISFWNLWRINAVRFHLASFLAKIQDWHHLYIPFHSTHPRFFYALTQRQIIGYCKTLNLSKPNITKDKDNLFLTFSKLRILDTNAHR